ncbi:TMEM175 family protein [Methanobacterium petrolearium]|uniref:TMEM175 family protein n=1 Tax=Methanobacterium petrolearium TaxID=710190 RepID=UPI001AE41E16|nr:TMEM175 family protein [Methanobacterium petrolearium]MBP1946854.1 putative membrane protein [Methanobacterium petrolearium]
MSDQSNSINLWMTTSRIETLVDGIFAIAMTLLVLSIGVPTITGNLNETAFQHELLALWSNILCYALSFWILSGFWRNNHQQFQFIKRSNPTLITINVVWLLFIALMPFSTEIIAEYGGTYFTANVIFQLNLFLAGFLYIINWQYATRNGLLDEDISERTIKMLNISSVILPTLSLIALVLSYYVLAWSSLVYLIHPFLKKMLQNKFLDNSS